MLPALFRAGCALALACALTLPAPADAQPDPLGPDDGRFRPILVQTEGAGPALTVRAFVINPDIEQPRAARGRFASDRAMQAIREGFEAHRDARADHLFRMAAWDDFSFAFGVAGEVLTQAENIGQLSLTNINSAMTELGLFMTVWQVSLDLSNGDDRAAGISAFRGLLGYARSKLGWPSLNLFSPAIFVLDHALTSFGQQAWLLRTDAWRQAYAGYYAEYDRRARAAELGPQADHLPPTEDERLRAIRARTEGGRSRQEWVIVLRDLQRRADSHEHFVELLQDELRDYTTLFWRSPQFELYSRDAAAGRGTWGLARGASLTAEIRSKLEDEHTEALMDLFVRQVLPLVTHMNWIDATRREVARLNAELRPALNAPVEIVVSALDIDGPTLFEIPLPAGGVWGGTLAPGRDRVLRPTTLAWLRAGLPSEIRLLRPEGPETQALTFDATNRAVVQFGVATVELIWQWRVTEGPAVCRHEFLPPSTRAPETVQRPADPPWRLSTAMRASGAMQIGEYSAQDGWGRSATGLAEGTTVRFAEPHYRGIASLSECSGGFLEGQAIADMACRLTRVTTDPELVVPARITCESTAELVLAAGYLLTGGEARFYDFDGPGGAELRAIMLRSMQQMRAASGGAR